MTTSKEELLNLFCPRRCPRETSSTLARKRQIAAAARAAVSATHENNKDGVNPTGGGENLKPERLSRGLLDTLNTLGEKIEGKDDDICVREGGAVETKHLPSREHKVKRTSGDEGEKCVKEEEKVCENGEGVLVFEGGGQ